MTGDLLHVVTTDDISARRRLTGRVMIWGTAGLLVLVAGLQTAQTAGWADFGFATWRPTLYACFTWSIGLCWGQVILRGEQGKRLLCVLPAVLFVVSLAIVPLVFGRVIAFSDWNLSNPEGRQFNGLDNVRQMWTDPFYWNALRNMVWYSLAILVEYTIALRHASGDGLSGADRDRHDGVHEDVRTLGLTPDMRQT